MSTRARSVARASAVGALALALGACASPAFLNVDPWPAASREQQSDAWMSGGRYATGAIVASDVPPHQAGDGTTPAQSGDEPAAAGPALGGLEPAPSDAEPLLAWDGDVVDGPQRGTVTERDDPTRGLEPSPGGRMYLLQLYQDVLDERDRLADEVRALRKGLGEAQARLDDTSTNTSELSGRLDHLAAEVERLGAENEDLAARLATAQIRRLEAEKLLLEARIEWYRTAEASAPAGDESLSATGTPPTSAGAREGR